MASFTDQIVAFNPYIAQIPVDDYVRVGMIKQQQYNDGVQRVQGYIDSVAGLEVIKPEQKEYLQQRITNLQQEVGRVIQADFSNQQLVNSVGSLTSKIASDPIVQTSVSSTLAYKQGLASMKSARDTGKSSVSNEWDFNNQFQKWYNDKDVASQFNGKFTPYTDVTKKISQIIKDLEPNSQIEDNPFKRGAGGEILMDADGLPQIDFAMIEKGSKGLTPERIKAAIQANLTMDDLNQLTIDGRYSYRHLDAPGMQQAVARGYEYKLNQVNDIIRGLMIERAGANNDPQKAAQIDQQIQNFKDRAVSYQNGYRQDVATMSANLEGFKGQFYTNNWLTKFGDGYAYAQNSLTYKENPYFMAAERRRENDIKFEEFKLNKQFQLADLALKEKQLELGWYNAETARMRASASRSKKEAKGALEGIPLSDAILEPIVQDELDDIDLASFVDETQKVSDEIDNQKMALLAQNTDLVVVKRDPTGLNPRYEYNVAGRDPNVVKAEAEAAILKLKDAYDRDPNSVDDGARTYFSNLSNADQVVQNRKYALGNVQSQANRDVGTLSDVTKGMKPMTFRSATGATYSLSAEQVIEFNRKVGQTMVSSPVLGPGAQPVITYDDKKAAALFQTPAEKFLYNLWKKEDKTPADEAVIGELQNRFKTGNIPNAKLISDREKYVNTSIREITSVQQPVSFTLEAFKGEDRKRAQAVVSRLLNSTVAAGKENTSPYYSEKKAKEILGKNADNTTYSLVSRGRGRYSLAVSNTEVTGDPVELDITRTQAEELFGQGQFLDDFYNIRQSIQLSKSTGKWTTDVRGQGRESAFNLNSGALNKYSVKYHVEDPLKNGGLQVRMYIYDKTNQQWLPERTANFGQLLNEAQVTKFLSTVGDQYIDAVLQSKQ